MDFLFFAIVYITMHKFSILPYALGNIFYEVYLISSYASDGIFCYILSCNQDFEEAIADETEFFFFYLLLPAPRPSQICSAYILELAKYMVEKRQLIFYCRKLKSKSTFSFYEVLEKYHVALETIF